MTKVLLVEDDKSLREIYGVRLLAEGYDIVSAGDGEEALAMAIKERPALIVSDVMMPKISGFDMLDILRSTTETKDIKVIMMTALSSEDQRLRGEKLGADRYLVKSQVGIEDVVRTVHEVLGDMPGMTGGNMSQPQQPTAPEPARRPDVNALSPQQQQTNAPSLPQPGFAPTITRSPEEQGGLPRPTAPFSSESPRPANLGSRSLQPLGNDTPSSMGDLMARELNNGGSSPQLTQPIAPTPSQTQFQPAQQPDPSSPVVTQPTAQAQPSHMQTQPNSSGAPTQQQPAQMTPASTPLQQPNPTTPQGLNVNPISGHQIPSTDRQ
jgi:CheY-like chemotaxis protein